MTKVKYSIPYTPGLLDILDEKENIVGNQISDVYFSDNRLPSARHIEWHDEYWDELYAISKKYNCELHYVINPSIYDNDVYLEEGITELITILKGIWDKGVTILTFNNSILLRLEYFRKNIPPFKIKASVNSKIETLEQVMFWHQELYVNDIILDRSLNRNADTLTIISQYARENDIKLTLLANEGCLPNCSWKQHCDNMIVQYRKNKPDDVKKLQDIHSVLACTSHYGNKPADILRSPFIMPNDIDYYEQHVDIIKIAGRMKETSVLSNILEMYFLRSGNVSLFSFFSTRTPEAVRGIKFNDLLDLNFAEKTSNCKSQCSTCNFCERVMDQLMLEKHGVKTNYADQRKIFKPRT